MKKENYINLIKWIFISKHKVKLYLYYRRKMKMTKIFSYNKVKSETNKYCKSLYNALNNDNEIIKYIIKY